MSVRHYLDTDFPAVCRIYLDAKHDEFEFEADHFEITPLDQDALILAAFNESDVLVFENHEVMGFSASFEGQLRALFVHRNARGRGVGGALLNAVLSGSPKSLLLNVARSNLSARRFYEKNGFATVGEIVRQCSGNDVTYVKMVHAPADRGR